MAPGRSGLPQAGQLASVEGAAAGAGRFAAGGGTGGRLTEGVRAAPAVAPTATGFGAAAAGTVNGF